MDGQRAWREEAAALRRLAMLLHALSGLAECAAGRCLFVRALVLWLLRHAEAVVQPLVDDLAADHFVTFVVESLTVDPSATDRFTTDPFDADEQDLGAVAVQQKGDTPQEALHLAASLRMLALQLEALASLTFPVDDGLPERLELRGSSRHPDIACVLKALTGLLPPVCRVPAPDTS
jgi:hypothetical protein